MTTDCGRYAVLPSGRIEYLGPRRSPVPDGASYYPDLSWYRLTAGRLVVGERRRVLWRSTGRFGRDVNAVAVSPQGVAFSYGIFGKRTTLYVARPGEAEVAVAEGESPLLWARNGALVTYDRGTLRVRGAPDEAARMLARGVHVLALDRRRGLLVFVAQGRIERFDGRLRALASTKELGLEGPLSLEPLAGGLVAARDRTRLVVVGPGGSAVASTPLPRERLPTDGVSSGVVASTGGAVAFTATQGNSTSGSRGVETVYVLEPGDTRAHPVYRERLAFALCERQAELSWRGSWLLYGSSEGHAAAIDARSRKRLVLTPATLPLVGSAGDYLRATWAGSEASA